MLFKILSTVMGMITPMMRWALIRATEKAMRDGYCLAIKFNQETGQRVAWIASPNGMKQMNAFILAEENLRNISRSKLSREESESIGLMDPDAEYYKAGGQ